ncbi:MAG: type II toxin-antitoxin system VapC family toxin [Acidobacteria bacterium]|nr:type II toxin-antitoxin system VapC family toxin [Acidobacteriota bacterium]
MNVVDSSGWLEYFADGPNATFFAPPIENVRRLIVPSITLYEVFKNTFRQRGESDALLAIAAMNQGRVVDLNESLALSAARISLEHKLPMADSMVLATARAFSATLWTQDTDFRGLSSVRLTEKGSSGLPDAKRNS